MYYDRPGKLKTTKEIPDPRLYLFLSDPSISGMEKAMKAPRSSPGYVNVNSSHAENLLLALIKSMLC